MSERRHRLARKLALERLATQAEQDAGRVDDDDLIGGASDADPEMVRQHLLDLARQLRHRAAKEKT